MKLLIEAKTPPAKPAATAEMPKAVVRTSDRIESDRQAGDLRIAHRPHGVAPRTCGSAAQKATAPATMSASDTMAMPRSPNVGAERRLGAECPMRPFQPPVEPLPFGGALLDHEAERDRDHREIGPAHAQRRDREQHAGHAGDDAAQAAAPARSPTGFVVRMPTV